MRTLRALGCSALLALLLMACAAEAQADYTVQMSIASVSPSTGSLGGGTRCALGRSRRNCAGRLASLGREFGQSQHVVEAGPEYLCSPHEGEAA